MRVIPVILLVLLGAVGSAPAGPLRPEVDLELILAADVSQSVDTHEAILQRRGYVGALRDPMVLRAIQQGRLGRIAVTYVEWAGYGQQNVTVPWTVIETAAEAERFASRLETRRILTGFGTSISSLLDAAVAIFEDNPWRGERRVIDISGDGPNNLGTATLAPRQRLVAAGVTINAVPIQTDGAKLPDLDVYFAECVIGGPGAFVVLAHGFAAFADAVRRKLLLEIAGVSPEPALRRVQFLRYDGGARPVYAPACDIGERL